MKLQTHTTQLLAACSLLTAALPLAAQHYPNGAEGIKGASLPPPGLYFKDYNVFYTADRYVGGPPSFDLTAYVQAPRLIWMTDWQPFGTNSSYGMDIIVPFAYKDVSFAGYDHSAFGLADIQIEPVLLSKHLKQWDIAGGYSFWAPTGSFDPTRPEKPGSGFWSHMFTLGATWYPDEEKTIAISMLNRYEIAHEQDETDLNPGHAYTVEWGISKAINKAVDVGLIGYYQQSFLGDGPEAYVVGVGPEVSAFCSKLGLFTSLRYIYEVDAENRPQGHQVVLTITKPF